MFAGAHNSQRRPQPRSTVRVLEGRTNGPTTVAFAEATLA